MSKAITLAPTNMTEAMEFSKMISASGMCPTQYRSKPNDILVAIQWGYEIGLPPLQALQNIAVINGKPSIYGDAALALVKNDSRCMGVTEWVEGEGENKTAYCVVKRKYGEEIEETKRTFSVTDAKSARLWGKQGPWTQYPDRMLQMRARGFALRDSFPDALKGVITIEEAQDYPQQKDITPKNPLDKLTTKAEVITEPPQEVSTEFQIQIPNSNPIMCSDSDDRIAKYKSLVGKIKGSPKLEDSEKDKKVAQLYKTNAEWIDELPTLKKIQLNVGTKGDDDVDE